MLVLVAVLLLAINLRVAVASLGVLLPQVQPALGMSDTFAGLLTTVPVWCFAVFGAATAPLSSRLGLDRTAAAALALITIGLLARPYLDGRWAFLLLSVVAIGGAALGNVLLPALAKEHFPHRLPLISSLYGAALVTGTTVAAATTVPLADALGGWRPGLVVWASLSTLALLPWLALGIINRKSASEEARWPLRKLARSPFAWAMAMLFAAQSATAYAQFGWFPAILIEGGLSRGEAALMLALITGVSIPLTLLLPLAMRVTRHSPVLPVGYAAVGVAGWLGVVFAPATAPWLWAVLLGAGSTAFTWVLALLGEKSHSVPGTAALSGFVQGVGYLLATIGPLGAGVAHELTGSWTPAILGLIVLAVLIGVLGTIINRPHWIEDDLDASSPGHRNRTARPGLPS